jgi:hypothetical protein
MPYSLTSAFRINGASGAAVPTEPPETNTGRPVARASRAPYLTRSNVNTFIVSPPNSGA